MTHYHIKISLESPEEVLFTTAINTSPPVTIDKVKNLCKDNP
ncbi:MAG: hypothetical protein PUA53_02575 [Chlamydia suis]|nr:hypothetical protein [Chlamydia suis]